ncbi:MAG: GTP-binding protein [Eubacteriales bacterium]|jgi:bifunctional enzyme CysN/CysC|nr:GTP-binding protein [Eubacteriales bacterium]
MNIVIVGHVDHGKSTVIGRLLADTNSLPEGRMEMIREMCRRNSKVFEYAFLLDALKDERSQGITIDAARCFFHTQKRKYIIIDAPGHIEFLKNMITGASRAEAALLVIDAKEGVRENSRRHGYMLSMLGIKQVAVLVNKLDLAGYDRRVFAGIVSEYTAFLDKINVKPTCFIPVSATEGVNIASHSEKTPWYTGNTVLQELDAFVTDEETEGLPFRMPVQDVYKFTREGDNRRIIAGMIDSGSIAAGDEVVFYPSGKKTTVKTIESFNRPPQSEAHAGNSVGFTVNEQIYIRRGELAAKANEPAPHVATRVKTSLFWLGPTPMEKNKTYLLKIGSIKTEVMLDSIIGVMDASDLSSGIKSEIGRNDVAECVLVCEKPIAFDLASDLPATGRFVIVDNYEISGGGIITEALTDRLTETRELVLRRNYKWEQSSITPLERAERMNQKAALVLITGGPGAGKKTVAKALERRLFNEGKNVYYLGIGSLLYGVAADIKTAGEIPERGEHIRRLGEVANLLLDTGVILIVTATALTAADMEVIGLTVEPSAIHTVWLGEDITTDVKVDLHLPWHEDEEYAVRRVKEKLQDTGFIFKA